MSSVLCQSRRNVRFTDGPWLGHPGSSGVSSGLRWGEWHRGRNGCIDPGVMGWSGSPTTIVDRGHRRRLIPSLPVRWRWAWPGVPLAGSLHRWFATTDWPVTVTRRDSACHPETAKAPKHSSPLLSCFRHLTRYTFRRRCVSRPSQLVLTSSLWLVLFFVTHPLPPFFCFGVPLHTCRRASQRSNQGACSPRRTLVLPTMSCIASAHPHILHIATFLHLEQWQPSKKCMMTTNQ